MKILPVAILGGVITGYLSETSLATIQERGHYVCYMQEGVLYRHVTKQEGVIHVLPCCEVK